MELLYILYHFGFVSLYIYWIDCWVASSFAYEIIFTVAIHTVPRLIQSHNHASLIPEIHLRLFISPFLIAQRYSKALPRPRIQISQVTGAKPETFLSQQVSWTKTNRLIDTSNVLDAHKYHWQLYYVSGGAAARNLWLWPKSYRICGIFDWPGTN